MIKSFPPSIPPMLLLALKSMVSFSRIVVTYVPKDMKMILCKGQAWVATTTRQTGGEHEW